MGYSKEMHITRAFDVFFSLAGLCVLSPLLFIVHLVLFFDVGSPLFIQVRVGRGKCPFKLIKFRTMPVGTTSVASHLLVDPNLSQIGSFLRKTKIDELPQLWNVLRGDMSLVGPRPNLYNQDELLFYREFFNVYDVRPGITGVSQIRGLDMSKPKLLAETDAEMIRGYSMESYFKCLFLTLLGKGFGDRLR